VCERVIFAIIIILYKKNIYLLCACDCETPPTLARSNWNKAIFFVCVQLQFVITHTVYLFAKGVEQAQQIMLM